ncbi:CBM96 family carbohydrate-binding protein [Dyadobacter sandarakinus]|uniref:DNRLRE domain-containing protein n=1 Tax=Dyadobacter sandarakinus TaxID=2747268 RepID=A0ABX7I7D6_9BACT|nr:DNRLRE domain-containing protein [Dyadobacter sandarakinus]QRR01392.1 DNRLRE domain-containing protein [Dyadobacter sandarakinus]
MELTVLHHKRHVARIYQLVILLALVFLGFSKTGFAQPAVLWDKTLGGAENDELSKVITTSDGGMLVGASSESGVSVDKSQASRGKFDFWIVKLSSDGTRQWDKRFGGTENDRLVGVQQTSDGGYILAGTSDSEAGGDKSENDRGAIEQKGDFWVIKISSNGTKLWDKTIGSTSNDIMTSMVLAPDNSILLGGYTTGTKGADKSEARLGRDVDDDIWIVKLSANGTKQWDKTLGTVYIDRLRNVSLTAGGEFLIAGDNALYRFSQNGNQQWEKAVPQNYPGSYLVEAFQTKDGGYILGLRTSEGRLGMHALKLDAGGNIVWSRFVKGRTSTAPYNSDELACIRQTPDGGYILAGASVSKSNADKSEDVRGVFEDFWMVKLSPNGVREWDKTMGGGGTDRPTSIELTKDGGYLIGGVTDSHMEYDKTTTHRGSNDCWLLRFAPDRADNKLSFSANALNFVARVGSPSPPAQTLVLNTSGGSPAVTFTKLSKADWLILPPAALGTVSFRVNPGNLAYGTYQVRIKASAPGFVGVDLDITMVLQPAISGRAVRINAGGKAFTAADGRVFSADRYYSGVDRVSSVTGDILGTTDDELYRNARTSAAISYDIPAPNGQYMLVLHFAEIYFGAPGGKPLGERQRLFNVNIEGQRRYTNFDIIAFTVAPMRVFRFELPITITDGRMNIDLTTGAADLPTISAIEMVPLEEYTRIIEVTAAEDATVRADEFASQNFGSSTLLDVKSGTGSSIDRYTYLKFPFVSINEIISAKLRIYGNNVETGSAINLSAYGIEDDSWTESGITWKNAPIQTNAALSTVDVSTTLNYYELDVTAFVRARSKSAQKGGGLTSIILKNPSARNRKLTFHSRENPSGLAPQLIIQTSGLYLNNIRTGAVEEEVVTIQEKESSVIYPNPVSGHFMLKLSDKHQGKVSLNISNELGQSIELPASDQPVQEVNISNLSLQNGIYLLKVQSVTEMEVLRILLVK